MTALSIAIVLLGLLVSYLLGSIPTGFLLAKALKGIDIREHGSGNTGATNVFRVIGKGAGITALLIDLIKGASAVLLMYWLVSFAFGGDFSSSFDIATLADGGELAYGDSAPIALLEPVVGFSVWQPWLSVFSGLLAVLGHSKSVWLGFSGGKSAATGLGVLLALAWPVGLGAAVVFGVALGISRTVSVGSIAAALLAGVLMFVTRQPLPYVVLALVGGVYVVVMHRSNISRLMAGTEPKTFGG